MHTDDDRPPSEDDAQGTTATSAGTGGDVAVSGFEAADTPLSSPPEVPSRDMDAHDPDVTGEIEVPETFDDIKPHPAKSDPGFDGWLDVEEGEPDSDDPYTSLSTDEEDDDASEIADWMAFTGGAVDEAPDAHEPDVIVDVTDGATEESSSGDLDVSQEDLGSGSPMVDAMIEVEEAPHEDTIEFVLGDPDGDETVEDGGDETARDVANGSIADEAESLSPMTVTEPDEDLSNEVAEVAADELHVIPVIPVPTPPVDDDPGSSEAGGGIGVDDTGEIPLVAAETVRDSREVPGVFDYQGDDLTSEHYLHAATREHHELAAAVTAARAAGTEQVAVSAAIPGLESGVVGFDDVVASEDGGSESLAKPPKSSDLLVRVGTGAALILAFAASLLWRPAIIVLALAVFVIAAGEFYSVLIHRHYKPVSIFGFLGIVGAGLGTVVWGVIAIPITFALMIAVLLLFDAVSQRRKGAVSGFTLTILVALWIGGLGAFAFPIIAADDYQVLVMTVVAMVALVDIAAYGVGRSIGRRPFAPVISPKKTIEGFVGGTLMALLSGSVASFFVAAIDLPAGLLLGVVVAIFAPLGDLGVSVAKRSLDIKDMGSILPGHGGLLDRIDAIIAVIPAAWAVLLWLGLL